MLDYFATKALTDYFFTEVTVGTMLTDKKVLFDLFSKIYLLDGAESERIYRLTQSKELTSITSLQAYYRHRRIKQFALMNDYGKGTDQEADRLIDLKGFAIESAVNARILQDNAAAWTTVCDDLMRSAEKGNILAMRILGCLLSEGIAMGRNSRRGLSMIHRSAGWGNEEALLAALYYDKVNRPKYLARLREKMLNTGHGDLFDRVETAYGSSTQGKDESFGLLEKAFQSGSVDRGLYSKPYARLIYSEIIDKSEKERLVCSQSKERVTRTSALPLKLSASRYGYNSDKLVWLSSDKENESAKILKALANSDLRALPFYRPLCLISDSRCILNTSASRLSDCFECAHIARIELSELSERDLETTEESIFIRSCDENRFNVFLIFFRGSISDRSFDAAKAFLQSAKRKAMHLYDLGVTLDLSAILPICFCDKENAKRLAEICESVPIEEPTEQSKKAFIDDILHRKSKLYGIDRVELEAKADERLRGHSIDEIDICLDNVLREHRTGSLLITAELMQPYFKSASNRRIDTFGFGGYTNEKYK